jgi:FkbM family methyltransferase
MSLISYFRDSWKRKRARRVFQEYGYRIDQFTLASGESIEFANWLNPLIRPKRVNQQELDFFRKYIPRGSFAIDIGAHIGDTTVPMGIAAGREGLVLGLDPNPQVFKILEVNARLNAEMTHIIPWRLAVAETEKEFYFASSEASLSNGGLIEDLQDNRHGKYKFRDPIRAVNLTRFLLENYEIRLPALSFIKIDTEGLDYFILKTLHPLLDQYHPTMVTEIFEGLSPARREETFYLLKQYGYSLMNIGDFETNIHYSPKPVNRPSEMPRPGLTENILAFLKDRD